MNKNVVFLIILYKIVPLTFIIKLSKNKMIKKSQITLIWLINLMAIHFLKYSNGYFHLYKTLNMAENETVRYYDCFYSPTT
jgi:hypothetical protein